MNQKLITLLLKPLSQVRQSEAHTAFLMFLYSFLVMAAYNVIKPVTRSKFIETLGPDNLPYFQLIAGVIIGFVMMAYSWLVARLPRRWCLSIAQGGIAAVLLVFWFLFRSGQAWVSVAFYLVGLILGILLISQFWTLANVVFDARQAKRLFGLIGGGASLGGILGSYLAGNYAAQLGTANLLLFSSCFLMLSILVVFFVVRRERVGWEQQSLVAAVDKGVDSLEALRLLRKSKHLRLIALVISFAAVGAAIIEQQLNMAATAVKGRQATDAITMFLANVQLWTSTIGFLVQVFLTSRTHRYLGIGFALLMLPVSLGSTAIIMLFNSALWAPGLARVLDQSLRYTIDKTTREVLYMPLQTDVKLAAKPFVDVTVDRFARGTTAVLLLLLIKPWGLGLDWQKLSYASIAITGIWILFALKAQHGYRDAFRESFDTRDIKLAEVSVAVADLPTIETLVQELASPDERRVLYAIEFLEALNKKHLITPLLLFHESPAVRARALSVVRTVQPEISERWLPAIQAMMTDPDPDVRSEAVGALANVKNQKASDLVRSLLRDKNPRIALTSAMVLIGSGREEDALYAESVLSNLVSDMRESAVPVRRDFAIAIRRAPIPHFRRLLIPLLNDPNPEVADEAMRSTQKIGADDFIFIPTLVSLLRNRRQKGSARELLIGYGEEALPILRHFLRDADEDIWIRRHIPATIARIPCQMAMDILVEALDQKDGFLRFHVIAGLERIHRIKPELLFNHHRIESQIVEEAARYSERRRLHWILFEMENFPKQSLLARATVEKMKRALDRIYRLLSLLYPWKDVAAARHTMEHGDPRSRAATLEYLDNLLAGGLRRTLIPLLEDIPPNTHNLIPRETKSHVEAAVIRLINDEDPVVASTAIYFVWQQKFSNLIDEVGRVLAAREAQDRHVLEAASWVLQEFRSPAPKRRLIWLDPLPSVDLANQMCRLPLFGSVMVDEVFRICDTGRQEFYQPGKLLCQEHLIPENVQFLLNGRVAVTRRGRETRQIVAPAVLAFQEVLEERPMAESARTAEMSVCLTLTSEEIQALLADNSDLVSGLFQMLLRNSGQAGPVVLKGYPLPQSALPANGDFNPIEKGLVLKTIPVFSLVSPDEILALASVAVEMHLTEGSDLFAEADRPAIYVLMSGELFIETSEESRITAGPCDAIGIYETLAGINFEFRAHVGRAGIALRIDRADLFDLLGQRSMLLRQVFGTLFRNQPAKAQELSNSL
jgi:ATP:ADP antiporter, AAA family